MKKPNKSASGHHNHCLRYAIDIILHYSKMALVNINDGLKEEYSMEQDLFS